MKKFLTIISGRPKEGSIRECVKPFIFYHQLAFCTWLMYMGFTTDIGFFKFMFALTSVILAWQAGWGMSIERFINSEKEKINDV